MGSASQRFGPELVHFERAITKGGIAESESDDVTLGLLDGRVRIGLGEDECTMGSSGIGVPIDPPLVWTRFWALELHPTSEPAMLRAIPVLATETSAPRRVTLGFGFDESDSDWCVGCVTQIPSAFPRASMQSYHAIERSWGKIYAKYDRIIQSKHMIWHDLRSDSIVCLSGIGICFVSTGFGGKIHDFEGCRGRLCQGTQAPLRLCYERKHNAFFARRRSR